MPDANETLALVRTLRASRGVEGRAALSAATWRWCSGFAGDLPARFWVHDDDAAVQASDSLGYPAFTRGRHVYIGRVDAEQREAVLRHELVHIAQVERARRSGGVAPTAVVEAEAERMAAEPVARPVRYGADPSANYGLWWVPIGVGLYILLRPGVANAPGPSSTLVRRPTLPEIALESFALLVIPGGAVSLGGRLGFGFLGSMAFAGAASGVALRGAKDVGGGALSSPLLYLFDASTGAIIGFVVPGGFRLFGRAGNFTFDQLATYGMVRADITIAEQLAAAAAKEPLNAEAAKRILNGIGLGGRVSQWWLERRGMLVLYRGQTIRTEQILSPVARGEGGIAASENLVERMRAYGMSTDEILRQGAILHDTPARISMGYPPTLAGLQLGGVGIPTTRLPGIAANFSQQAVVYVLRVPRNTAFAVKGWGGLLLEEEYIILNSVPSGSVMRIIPATEFSPLKVNEKSQLVPGNWVP